MENKQKAADHTLSRRNRPFAQYVMLVQGLLQAPALCPAGQDRFGTLLPQRDIFTCKLFLHKARFLQA